MSETNPNEHGADQDLIELGLQDVGPLQIDLTVSEELLLNIFDAETEPEEERDAESGSQAGMPPL